MRNKTLNTKHIDSESVVYQPKKIVNEIQQRHREKTNILMRLNNAMDDQNCIGISYC